MQTKNYYFVNKNHYKKKKKLIKNKKTIKRKNLPILINYILSE